MSQTQVKVKVAYSMRLLTSGGYHSFGLSCFHVGPTSHVIYPKLPRVPQSKVRPAVALTTAKTSRVPLAA